MQLQKATKSKVKLKIALQGTSGSGKTYSALQLAYGITADWTKIAVIDTENESSNYYANQGEFNVLSLQSPFTPDRYLEAIQACIKAGMECIIIDSITHEWDGIGGILEMHEKATRNSRSGNSFNAWASITPLHNKFVQFIVDAPVHIIGTLRTKSDYVLQDRNGKQVPVKVGMKAITRDGMEYEFGIGFEIDLNHTATCSKDRTGLFVDAEPFVITSATGQKLVEWANTGVDAPKPEPAPQPAPKVEVPLSERIINLEKAFLDKSIDRIALSAITGENIDYLTENGVKILREMFKEVTANPAKIKEISAKYFEIFHPREIDKIVYKLEREGIDKAWTIEIMSKSFDEATEADIEHLKQLLAEVKKEPKKTDEIVKKYKEIFKF